jgi:hypothetical protein
MENSPLFNYEITTLVEAELCFEKAFQRIIISLRNTYGITNRFRTSEQTANSLKNEKWFKNLRYEVKTDSKRKAVDLVEIHGRKELINDLNLQQEMQQISNINSILQNTYYKVFIERLDADVTEEIQRLLIEYFNNIWRINFLYCTNASVISLNRHQFKQLLI